MKNRIYSLLLALTILISIPVTAFAVEIPDIARKDCRIDVVLWDNVSDKGIVGAELVLYRIGYVGNDEDQNYYFYDLKDDRIIEKTSSPLTAADYDYDVKQNLYTEKYKESFEKEGIYSFKDLPTGLYLVVQEKPANKYGDMSSFLVGIPYIDNGEYVYHVTADVKTELKKETEPTTSNTGSSSGEKLPQTGQLSWPIPWMASSGMVLFALGWWLCFGRRKDPYET